MDTLNSVLAVPFVQFVSGAVVAALIGLGFSWWGTKQLRDETEKLRKLNVLTIRILDEAELLPEYVKPAKDEAGNYTGGFAHIRTSNSHVDEVTASARQEDTDAPETEPQKNLKTRVPIGYPINESGPGRSLPSCCRLN